MPEPISHEQGIILPDQSVQRGTLDLPADILPNGVTQDNFTTEGGLVVPNSRGGVLKAVRQILRGTQQKNNQLEIPDNKGILEYGINSPEILERQISVAEIQLLILNPRLFLEKELKKTFATSARGADSEHVIEVISQVKNPDSKNLYSLETLQRIQRKQRLGENSYNTTDPGVFEQAAEAMTGIIDCTKENPLLSDSVGSERVAGILEQLLSSYRFHNKLEYVPEMPELINKLLHSIDSIHVNRTLRFALYDCLEQIQIPLSLHQDVLWVMDRQNDLRHPLAFQLTMAIANHSEREQSTWLTEQDRRSEELCLLLDNSAQNLFDNYDTVKRMSASLVSSTNYQDPITGKVGLEVEFQKKEMSEFSEYEMRELNDGWSLGYDVQNEEMRRYDNNLTYDRAYRASITSLAHFFRDYAKHLSSLHIHLDNFVHKLRPDLNGMLGNNWENVKQNNHGTWEVRGLLVPFDRSKQRLDPQSINNVIELYIAASNPAILEANEQIHISTEEPLSYDRILWGHMCVALKDAHARLAALKSLDHPNMLRSFNPLAFIQSYNAESLPAIARSLTSIVHGDFQVDMLHILKGFIERGVFTIDDIEGLSGMHFSDEFFENNPQVFRKSLIAAFDQGTPQEQEKVFQQWIKNFYQYPDELYTVYQGKNEDFRLHVVATWTSNPRDFLDQLRNALEDPDINIRLKAMTAWMIEPELFSSEIKAAYAHGSEDKKMNAVIAWASRAKLYREKLIVAASDTDPIIREIAVQSFIQSPLDFKEQLARAFQDKTLSVRWAALDAWCTHSHDFDMELKQAFRELYEDSENSEQLLKIVETWVNSPLAHSDELDKAISYPFTKKSEKIKAAVIMAWGSDFLHFHSRIKTVMHEQAQPIHEAVFSIFKQNSHAAKAYLLEMYSFPRTWHLDKKKIISIWLESKDFFKDEIKGVLDGQDPDMKEHLISRLLINPFLFRDEILELYDADPSIELRKKILKCWGSFPYDFKNEIVKSLYEGDSELLPTFINILLSGSIRFRIQLFDVFKMAGEGDQLRIVNKWKSNSEFFSEELTYAREQSIYPSVREAASENNNNFSEFTNYQDH